MKTLLIATAGIELVAGLALLFLPSIFVQLLVGTNLETPAALLVARIGGAALTALSIACWLASDDANSRGARGLVAAMTFYNLAVASVLAFAGLKTELHGIALWPAVALHSAMAVWCVACLRYDCSNEQANRPECR
jgi:hypothetical protein